MIVQRAVKKPSLTLVILESLVNVVGILSFPSLRHFAFYGVFPKKYTKNYAYLSLQRMRKQGLLHVKKVGPNIQIKITKKGIEKFRYFKKSEIQISIPKKWDKKWRLLVFDIPEKLRDQRNSFRYKLKELGFVRLQQSTWVFPYECQSAIMQLCELYNIANFVSLFQGEVMGDDAELRRNFNLS